MEVGKGSDDDDDDDDSSDEEGIKNHLSSVCLKNLSSLSWFKQIKNMEIITR